VRWLKSGSFGFAEGSALCVGAKPNVPLVRLAKIVFKKCAVGKKYNTKRWAVVSEKSPLLSLYVVLSFR
jgi:hypothetical protein